MKTIVILFNLVSCLSLPTLAVGGNGDWTNVHLAMMESTVSLAEPVDGGRYRILGTGFVIQSPAKLDAENGRALWAYTLVTADHVLAHAKGDRVLVGYRTKSDAGAYTLRRQAIRIRDEKTPLWKKHESEDIAAMLIPLPKEGDTMRCLNTSHLIGDEQLEEWGVYPGARLYCLGYPLGVEANELGFPILRSGIVASRGVQERSAARAWEGRSRKSDQGTGDVASSPGSGRDR